MPSLNEINAAADRRSGTIKLLSELEGTKTISLRLLGEHGGQISNAIIEIKELPVLEQVLAHIRASTLKLLVEAEETLAAANISLD